MSLDELAQRARAEANEGLTGAQKQLADLNSHHIQGYRDDTGVIDIPLISHVEGNLWQGGCKDGVEIPEDFKYVVSLYMWEKYSLPDWTSRITVKMFDAATMPDEGLIRSLGKLVNNLAYQGKTLVHCQAGLNRSGLIAALALMEGGYSAEGAIKLLREQRSPAVLCNQTFENWLLHYA